MICMAMSVYAGACNIASFPWAVTLYCSECGEATVPPPVSSIDTSQPVNLDGGTTLGNMLAVLAKRLAAVGRTVSRTVSSYELRIPVPHGHIAAKVWGYPESVSVPNRRVMAAHGWQDNANSFDPLVTHPEMGLHRLFTPNSEDKGLCIVALDFTGHGFSSRLPPGSIYTHHRYVLDIAVVANFLRWNKFTLIAHSMGAGMAFYFALMFPDRVAKVALFDGMFPFWYPASHYEWAIGNAYSSQAKYIGDVIGRTVRPPKEYTMDDYLAAASLATVRKYAKKYFPLTPEGSASTENMKILLERGSQPTSQGRFVLVRDPSVRFFFTELSGPLRLGEFLHRFDNTGMKMIAFMAEKGATFVCKDTYDILEEEASDHLASYKTVFIKGGSHHMHMNEPEKILPRLTEFLVAP
ncbi:serine hydrolase protein-like [Tropilaelaps mercedesae]|uniref:Serine hydrolase protein-like n=1 Tax=Tropilaelaps mercedesae TaxID=418985 RepID=A0A1V9WYI7_9ACAR|nr:serine hydrolase protein-like [Tropilaelaps mercedesae]